MSASFCRLLPYTVADGPANMAADEVILESAAQGIASLRFYGWSVPTLSLGYFQPAAARLTDPLLATLPWLRRPTGGEALVHDRELTYALALPSGATWQPRELSWTDRMHCILATALRERGVMAASCTGEQHLGEFLCFLHPTPGDLLVGSVKIVGSAQRRRRGALLQHGSVLLAASPNAPRLPGIAEMTGRSLEPLDLAVGVAKAFGRATGWQIELNDWSSAECERTRALASDRYAASAWNERR